MNSNAVLDESVDELGRGQEISLIRRNDVASRVTLIRRAQQLVVLQRNTARLAAETLRAVTSGRVRCDARRPTLTLFSSPGLGRLRGLRCILRHGRLHFGDAF